MSHALSFLPTEDGEHMDAFWFGRFDKSLHNFFKGRNIHLGVTFIAKYLVSAGRR